MEGRSEEMLRGSGAAKRGGGRRGEASKCGCGDYARRMTRMGSETSGGLRGRNRGHDIGRGVGGGKGSGIRNGKCNKPRRGNNQIIIITEKTIAQQIKDGRKNKKRGHGE